MSKQKIKDDVCKYIQEIITCARIYSRKALEYPTPAHIPCLDTAHTHLVVSTYEDKCSLTCGKYLLWQKCYAHIIRVTVEELGEDILRQTEWMLKHDIL